MKLTQTHDHSILLGCLANLDSVSSLQTSLLSIELSNYGERSDILKKGSGLGGFLGAEPLVGN